MYYYDVNKIKRKERLAISRKKGTHTKKEWLEMKSFFNNTCVKCLGSSGLINVEKDHIIPIYMGGSDHIQNIQPLCARCNASKTGDITDYRQSACKYFGIKIIDKYKNPF